MEWDHINKSITLEQKFQSKKNSINNDLIEACSVNHFKNAIIAIKNGAFVNCDDEMYTPLMICVENNFLDMAKMLLQCDADPSIEIKNRDAILLAVQKKAHDFLAIFFSKRIRPNRDENGTTILMKAVLLGDLAAVKIIAPKVNINEKDKEGNTALLHCLMKPKPTQEDVEIGRLLIAMGADTRTRNLEGNNAEKLAISQEARVVLQEQQIRNVTAPKQNFSKGNNNNNQNKNFTPKNKKIKI